MIKGLLWFGAGYTVLLVSFVLGVATTDIQLKVALSFTIVGVLLMALALIWYTPWT